MQHKASVWRYRIEDDYASGTIINRAGPISEDEARALLERRFARRVVLLEVAEVVKA